MCNNAHEEIVKIALSRNALTKCSKCKNMLLNLDWNGPKSITYLHQQGISLSVCRDVQAEGLFKCCDVGSTLLNKHSCLQNIGSSFEPT